MAPGAEPLCGVTLAHKELTALIKGVANKAKWLICLMR